VDPAHASEVTALLEGVRAWTATCHAVVLDPVSAEAAAQAPYPWTADALHRACGGAITSWEAARASLGRSRAADALAIDLARAAVEVDYVGRSFGAGGPERRNALEHLRAAVAGLAPHAAQWPSPEACPYRVFYGEGHEAEWRRDVEADGRTVPESAAALDRLAIRQTPDPSFVRGRMLEAFGAAGLADLAAREAALGAGEAPERAYLSGLGTWRRTFVEVAGRFQAGEVRDDATRRQRAAEAEAGLAVWRAAFDAERSRWGP
jgi:hypothetical protein